MREESKALPLRKHGWWHLRGKDTPSLQSGFVKGYRTVLAFFGGTNRKFWTHISSEASRDRRAVAYQEVTSNRRCIFVESGNSSVGSLIREVEFHQSCRMLRVIVHSRLVVVGRVGAPWRLKNWGTWSSHLLKSGLNWHNKRLALGTWGLESDKWGGKVSWGCLLCLRQKVILT